MGLARCSQHLMRLHINIPAYDTNTAAPHVYSTAFLDAKHSRCLYSMPHANRYTPRTAARVPPTPRASGRIRMLPLEPYALLVCNWSFRWCAHSLPNLVMVAKSASLGTQGAAPVPFTARRGRGLACGIYNPAHGPLQPLRYCGGAYHGLHHLRAVQQAARPCDKPLHRAAAQCSAGMSPQQAPLHCTWLTGSQAGNHHTRYTFTWRKQVTGLLEGLLVPVLVHAHRPPDAPYRIIAPCGRP